MKDQHEEWVMELIRLDIAEAKELMEEASIEEVDTPTGRKEVEIAWEEGHDFNIEEGVAVGVYRDDGVYHIDWADERERTTVQAGDIVTFEEGDYYTDEMDE